VLELQAKGKSMRHPFWIVGALLGALISLPLIALCFLGQQFAGLPFVPFDLFDWLARRMPGRAITLGIDAIVRTILALNLGPISGSAKLIEQAIALGLVVIVGAILGALLALVLRRGAALGWRAGSIGGFVLFLLAAAMKYDLGFAGDPSLQLLWLAVLLMGWGALLGNAISFTLRQTLAPAPSADPTRRRVVLKLAGGSIAVALAAWGAGRLLQSARIATGASRPLELPKTPIAAAAASPAALAARLEPAPGTRAELTPTERFYRIDIDTRPPTIAGAGWSLQVAGLFSRPRSLALADIMAYPAVLQPITISCISNPIGGDLIGTSNWVGVRLPDLLADLGLRPEARELAIEAADGFYESVTMADMRDPRTLLVYGMNGDTLPIEHGFPLRIYIPNHYGMKQPKWITRIEAIDHEGAGFWVERGWSKQAHPQVISIIDSVTRATGEAGPVTLGGIAWAGDRGIQQVEVQVDDGAWSAARLRLPLLSPLTWVQWRYDGPVPPGRHTFRVRATDGTGALQVGAAAPPAPSGATGYHTLTATV
jgi:DMSO/TMAO reductase YedYZ molybdopterin-dependent catalytic subunit